MLEMAQCLRDIRIKCLSAILLDFSSWSQNGCWISYPSPWKEEGRKKEKVQNSCIISFDQENKTVSQHSPSFFATALLLLALHLPKLGHVAIPNGKDD